MEASAERTTKLWQPVAAAVLVQLALTALYVAKFNGDITALVGLGTSWAALPPYHDVTATIGPGGYDGQFYYAIAQAPWHKHAGDMDQPAGRHLRIFYPALCWLLSGGRPQWLFWIMPAVNLAAIAGLALVGSRLAAHFRMSPWWGFAFPLAINATLPALHNLTDPWSMLGLACLMWAWLRRVPWWAVSLAVAVALFAREQNLMIAVLLLGFALWQRRIAVAVGVLTALALYAGWVGYLWNLYGERPLLQVPGNFDVPLTGMFFRWTHLGGNDHFSRRLAIITALCMVHLLIQLGLMAYAALRRRGDTAVLLMACGGMLLALVGGNLIYRDFWAITRVFVWMPMGLWILSLQARRRWALALLIPAVLWPIVGALRYV